MEKTYFTGPFASLCEAFVAQKKATGAVYDTQAKRLRQIRQPLQSTRYSNSDHYQGSCIGMVQAAAKRKTVFKA